MNNKQHRVAVVPSSGTAPFELGIVTAVFGSYLADLVPRHYTLRVCADQSDPTPVDSVTMSAQHGLAELAEADTIITTSVSDVRRRPSDALLDAIRAAHRRGARIVSTCTGAFTLAASGLLDGRQVTTHWRYTDLLAEDYPAVQVDPNPLYIDGGDILTGAGSAASLDLCLHLVRKDLGIEMANTIARRLVIPPYREGGQAQYIESPVTIPAKDDGIARSMQWAIEHLTQPLTVEMLAKVARMSERSFLRHFAQTTGSSPVRWLNMQRVRASLPILETTGVSMEDIAARVGFESVVTYRYHFSRVMHTSPSTYRRVFRAERELRDTDPARSPMSAVSPG